MLTLYLRSCQVWHRFKYFTSNNRVVSTAFKYQTSLEIWYMGLKRVITTSALNYGRFTLITVNYLVKGAVRFCTLKLSALILS